ncbi:universal stress protein [Halorientalis pallida]|uniref:Universal stress protein n=1 Tax=Halorientalis pallida TaxID=2479928 RepID=A0A498KVJ0_9EURY|nr:universal stress protein [Halorientalis pallida]RXK49288.1 universal stress protein [Halorientalis pallida]
MYDRILLPTDGSEEATAVSDVAFDIAATHDGSVHVINVADTTRDSVTNVRGQIVDALVEEGERIVDAVEERARDRGVTVRTAVLQGAPSPTIVDYASASDIDLVVMPTRGRRGLERVLLGSVTERVISSAPVPVLVCNPGSEFAFAYPPERVLVPIDGSDAADRALSAGIDAATATGATLHLLTVAETASLGPDVRSASTTERLSEAAEETLEDARSRVEAAGIDSLVTAVQQGQPYREIRSYIDDEDIDQVVLGTGEESDFGRFLWGGVTSKLVRSSPIPVLMAPTRDG